MCHKRLAKFALIKYHINFWNYGIYLSTYLSTCIYYICIYAYAVFGVAAYHIHKCVYCKI